MIDTQGLEGEIHDIVHAKVIEQTWAACSRRIDEHDEPVQVLGFDMSLAEWFQRRSPLSEMCICKR